MVAWSASISLDELMERIREAIEVCLEVHGDNADPLDFVGVQRVSVVESPRFRVSGRELIKVLERPNSTAGRVGHKWYGCSAYKPDTIVKLLGISCVFYNCAVGKDGKTARDAAGIGEERGRSGGHHLFLIWPLLQQAWNPGSVAGGVLPSPPRHLLGKAVNLTRVDS